MEIMSRAVVKTRTLRPLPGEITSAAISNATLPVKIEAARRAIAECADLSVLLRYKSQAEGLAAAVRVMKDIGPEMIRKANELVADAWRKGGELLAAYSSATKRPGTNGSSASDRGRVASELGLTPTEASNLVRIYKAPLAQVRTALERTRTLNTTVRRVDRADPRRRPGHSSALRAILGGSSGAEGLTHALCYLRRIPLDVFGALTPDERKIVKAKITECTELLDEMDGLCQ